MRERERERERGREIAWPLQQPKKYQCHYFYRLNYWLVSILGRLLELLGNWLLCFYKVILGFVTSNALVKRLFCNIKT